jgi:hypothetical protein
MDEHGSLNHSKWECRYDVVFIPECRRKTLYGQLRQYLGEVFRKLAEQNESRIEAARDRSCARCQEGARVVRRACRRGFGPTTGPLWSVSDAPPRLRHPVRLFCRCREAGAPLLAFPARKGDLAHAIPHSAATAAVIRLLVGRSAWSV